jgi:hypothetical protein
MIQFVSFDSSSTGYKIASKSSNSSQWKISADKIVSFESSQNEMFESLDHLEFSSKKNQNLLLFLLTKRKTQFEWLESDESLFTHILPPPFHFHILHLPFVFGLYSPEENSFVSLSLSLFSKIWKHKVRRIVSTIHHDYSSIVEMSAKLKHTELFVNSIADSVVGDGHVSEQSIMIGAGCPDGESIALDIGTFLTPETKQDEDIDEIENALDDIDETEALNDLNESEHETSYISDNEDDDDLISDLDESASDIADEESDGDE